MGAMSVAGYNIRYSKATPPLKGRGGPRSGGEVRPRRQHCGVAVVVVNGNVSHWSKKRPTRQRVRNAAGWLAPFSV